MYKLLYVDDEELMRDCIFSAVAWEDLGVIPIGAAEDGEEALRMAAVEAPDIVVTDVIMPTMDGIELARRLRESLPDVKIIILSASSDFAHAQKAIEYEISSYVLKPFSPQVLVDKVKKAIREIESARGTMNPDRGLSLPVDVMLELKSAVVQGQVELIPGFIEAMFGEISPGKGGDLSVAKVVALGAWSQVQRVLDRSMIEKEPIGSIGAELSESVREARCVQDLGAALGACLAKAASLTRGFGVQRRMLAVERTRDIIDGEFMDPDLGLDSLAGRVNLSPSYLRQLFKKETGQSIGLVLTSVRMRHARELLATTDQKLHEIAASVGFRDEFYFSNVFKKHFGYRPSDVRARR